MVASGIKSTISESTTSGIDESSVLFAAHAAHNSVSRAGQLTNVLLPYACLGFLVCFHCQSRFPHLEARRTPTRTLA